MISPSEHSTYRDQSTGALVHRITNDPSISHPTYFLQSSFTRDDAELFFTSYRSGTPELHIARFPDGEIRQLTHGASIHPFSPVLHPDGRRIFFIAQGSIRWVDHATGRSETVLDCHGAQLGECSLDASGEWLVAAFKDGAQSGLLVCRTNGADADRIPFPRTVIHPQFHPLEPEWIEFAGDPAPRMHRVRRDGSGLECLFEHGNDEFVVHETFLGRTGDLVFTVWPRSLRRMNWTTREISLIADYAAAVNAWHITPNRAGTSILCDTNHPDRGLFLIDVESGAATPLCLTGSSNRGTQWKKSTYALAADFAAAQSAAKSGTLSWMEVAADSVYGPQWTHPHPAFSTDEKRVTFASDRTGQTQVYVVEVPANGP